MKDQLLSAGKRIWVSIALAAIVCVLGISSGCTFSSSHNQAHLESFKRDMHESHKFIDKHFMNFDWEDPENWYVEY